ncbi:unnamed protein product, partial [Polarella glacialis]
MSESTVICSTVQRVCDSWLRNAAKLAAYERAMPQRRAVVRASLRQRLHRFYSDMREVAREAGREWLYDCYQGDKELVTVDGDHNSERSEQVINHVVSFFSCLVAVSVLQGAGCDVAVRQLAGVASECELLRAGMLSTLTSLGEGSGAKSGGLRSFLDLLKACVALCIASVGNVVWTELFLWMRSAAAGGLSASDSGPETGVGEHSLEEPLGMALSVACEADVALQAPAGSRAVALACAKHAVEVLGSLGAALVRSEEAARSFYKGPVATVLLSDTVVGSESLCEAALEALARAAGADELLLADATFYDVQPPGLPPAELCGAVRLALGEETGGSWLCGCCTALQTPTPGCPLVTCTAAGRLSAEQVLRTLVEAVAPDEALVRSDEHEGAAFPPETTSAAEWGAEYGLLSRIAKRLPDRLVLPVVYRSACRSLACANELDGSSDDKELAAAAKAAAGLAAVRAVMPSCAAAVRKQLHRVARLVLRGLADPALHPVAFALTADLCGLVPAETRCGSARLADRLLPPLLQQLRGMQVRDRAFPQALAALEAACPAPRSSAFGVRRGAAALPFRPPQVGTTAMAWTCEKLQELLSLPAGCASGSGDGWWDSADGCEAMSFRLCTWPTSDARRLAAESGFASRLSGGLKDTGSPGRVEAEASVRFFVALGASAQAYHYSVEYGADWRHLGRRAGALLAAAESWAAALAALAATAPDGLAVSKAEPEWERLASLFRACLASPELRSAAAELARPLVAQLAVLLKEEDRPEVLLSLCGAASQFAAQELESASACDAVGEALQALRKRSTAASCGGARGGGGKAAGSSDEESSECSVESSSSSDSGESALTVASTADLEASRSMRVRTEVQVPPSIGKANVLVRLSSVIDKSNMAWAFGREDPKLFKAIAIAAVPRSNMAWAFATLGLAEEVVLVEGVAQEARTKLREFNMQELSNVAWASATLNLKQPEVFKSISTELLRRLEELKIHESDRPKLTEFARNVIGVIWAVRFVEGAKMGNNSDNNNNSNNNNNNVAKMGNEGAQGDLLGPLVAAARPKLLAIGRAMDGTAFPAASKRSVYCAKVLPSDADSDPQVVLDLSDRLVIQKPPGWQVDQNKLEMAEEEGEARRLSSFVQSLLPPHQWPIVCDMEHGCGFLHRLDVPCSGLVVVAKTYEAYYDLWLQLNAGSMVRDYAVLCHGFVSPDQTQIDARVHWVEGTRLPSEVQRFGKPATTMVKVLAHLYRKLPEASASGSSESSSESSERCDPEPEPFSLVALRILTGRRHQIRIHMAHIGHPLVTDGKYADLDVFLGDKEWCSRTFLHRYHLSFSSADGGREQVTVPLDPDLASALRGLRPADGDSAATLQHWLPGDETRSSEPLPNWDEIQALRFRPASRGASLDSAGLEVGSRREQQTDR